MQRDEHNSYFRIALYHDEVTETLEERINMSEHPHPTIIIENIHEAEIYKREQKSLQDVGSKGEGL